MQRIDQLKKSVLAALSKADLDLELRLVHELAASGGHDPSEVAAAILRVSRNDEALEEIDLVPQRPRGQRFDGPRSGGQRFGGQGNGPRQGGFQDRPPRDNQAWRDVEPGMTRFAINCGRWGGVRPADLVRALAENCDFPGSEVGAIKIFDRFALVDVPKEREEIVLERMPGTELRGRTVAIRIDEGPQPRNDGPRPPARSGYGGGPRDGGGHGGGRSWDREDD